MKLSINFLATIGSCILISITMGFAQSNDQHDSGPNGMSLKSALNGKLHIGAAIKSSQLKWEDPLATNIVVEEFNSITPENFLKWESVHPEPDTYHFCDSDLFVKFGQEHGMFMVGHVFVWHQQTPDWVFEKESGELKSSEELSALMTEHIQTVGGRYAGKIDGWDVVNEALEDDGTLRKTKWLEIMGENYIKLAFEVAREVDPVAQLYYNDYSLYLPEKRDGTVRLVKSLLDQGVKVDGIGMQGHWSLNHPSISDIKASIDAFLALGVKVHITELDIDVLPSAWDNVGADISANYELNAQLNPYTDGLPENVEQAQADRYRELFELFLSYPEDLVRVTLWGVTDKGSWRNDWPVKGRTAYPLLFDREGNPKKAHDAILEVAAKAD